MCLCMLAPSKNIKQSWCPVQGSQWTEGSWKISCSKVTSDNRSGRHRYKPGNAGVQSFFRHFLLVLRCGDGRTWIFYIMTTEWPCPSFVICQIVQKQQEQLSTELLPTVRAVCLSHIPSVTSALFFFFWTQSFSSNSDNITILTSSGISTTGRNIQDWA